MRVLFFILLLLPATVYSSSKISYFDSFNIENEDQTIQKVYCDPNNEDKFYYTLDNKVYSYLDGDNKVVLEFEENNENEEEKDDTKSELLELYNSIYEEEKEAIESEYGVDDAEEYYDDLIKERTELRMETESTSIRENKKEKEIVVNVENLLLVKNVIFLKNSSLNILIETVEGFYSSNDGGDNFELQESAKISLEDANIDIDNNRLLFTSSNKLYYFNNKKIADVDLETYKDEDVKKVNSFYPYITILTDKTTFLLKQDQNKLVLVNKFRFKDHSSVEKVFYSGGEYLFYLSKNKITKINVLTSDNLKISFSDLKIDDLSYNDNGLYLATDSGFFFFDFTTRELVNMSLGLLPEVANKISISSNDNIYVSNDSSVYILKEFETIKDLEKENNVFALMKKIELSYPSLNEIISAANDHNYLQNKRYNSLRTRNRLSVFMPKLQLISRWTLKNVEGSDGMISNSNDFNDSLYFQAFLYFDLSKWIFNSKELDFNKLNNDKNMLRNQLIEELTIYYNNRKYMELIYNMNSEKDNKLVFKMKMLEYGAIINSFTGKKFF